MTTNAHTQRPARPRELPGHAWATTFAIAVGTALSLLAWGLGTLAG